MSVLTVGDRMERITDALSILTNNVKLHNSRGREDINKDAEDFYAGLLNIMLGKQLQNLNLLEMNFAAIDLADRAGRLCVQVTSTEGRKKVSETLEKFFERKLDRDFDRLIVLIIGEKPKYQHDFKTERNFAFTHEEDVWDLRKLLFEIEKLDEQILEAVDEYLCKWVNTGAKEPKYPTLPLLTALEGDAFLGRREELAEIDRKFRTERIVFLTGLGGMGKTELAVRYAREFVQKRGHQAWQVLFSGDFRQTVLNNVAPNVPGLDTRNMTENEIFHGAIAALNRAGSHALLILDNADQGNLTKLRTDLGELSVRVLITTRQDEEHAIDVSKLHREELHRLFAQHEARVTPEEMDKLIDAVDGHTLTVDLMARALRPGFRAATAEKLLNNLADSTVKKVSSAYGGRGDQARINEHLRTVFRVLELSELEKVLLHFATLLPEEGMDPELFLQPFEKDPGDTMEELIRGGWLLWKDDLLRIHPVIRLVCIEELKPTTEICDSFLLWFRGQYSDKTTYDRGKFAQIAALYETASEVLQETDGLWACEAGYLWNELVEPRRALSCNHRAVEIREQNHPSSQGLAAAYNNLGSTYLHLGDHQKALEYLLKALQIREQVLPPNHPDLAVSYNNVGGTYGHLGDHQKELEYQLKALQIWEQVLPPNHPHLATSYNNLSSTYGNLGNHQKELEYDLKALKIREQVLPPTHPDLAASYNNVGMTYGNLGDHQKALEYQLKDLAICEQVLPPNHPHLATSYNNLSSTYGNLGNHQKELEYDLKALHIREQVLPPNHPDLAASYNNVGATYGNLGDHQKELEYLRKALGIQEQSLPADHPYNVMCRNNIAFTYARMNDFIQASEYMNRALDSAERSMAGHPNLEMFRQAAQIMELCAMFQNAGMPLPFDNPFL